MKQKTGGKLGGQKQRSGGTGAHASAVPRQTFLTLPECVCQSRPKSLEIVLQKKTVGQLRTSLQGGTRKSSAAIRGYGDVARERKQHARLDCRGWPCAVARQAPRPVQPVFRHLPALHAPAVYTLRCFLRLMHTTGSRMSAPRRRSTRSVRGTSAPRSSAGSVTPQCCRAWDPSRPHGNP